MPLDAERFGWSPAFPLRLMVVGMAMLIGPAVLFFRSYADNTFLSPLVRIQEEREQRVISTGVYGFVHHPMYLCGCLMVLGAPLLPGSLYGVAVGLALTELLMARIVGEEATARSRAGRVRGVYAARPVPARLPISGSSGAAEGKAYLPACGIGRV